MQRRDASAAVKGPVRAAARWAAALTAAGLALTGCGAGQEAQTGEKDTAIAGVNVDAGDLALRDLQVDFGESGDYPQGGSAPLRVWIANDGEESVALEGVTSPAAEAVTLVTEGAGSEPTSAPSIAPSPTPDGDPAEPTDEGDAEADASEAPGGDASPTAGASETPGGDETTGAEASPSEAPGTGPSGERDFTVEIAPGSHVRLAPDAGAFLMLEGLTEDVGEGSTVEVVFLFSNGEAVTAHLPVGEPSEAPSREYLEEPHDEH